MNLAVVVVAALAAASVLAFTVVANGGNTEADQVAQRLSRYGGGGGEYAVPRERTGNPIRDLVDTLTNALNPLLSRSSHSGKLAEDLQRADLTLKSSEWILAIIGIGIVTGTLMWLRFGSPIGFGVAVIAVYLVSGFYLKVRQRRRRRAFERQLGDTIVLLSNALKAGYSFGQALSTVSKSASPPISSEFGRATREIALGITVDDALNHMVRRNESEDFDLLVTAVQIQRVVGGNLAEILDTIAQTIRERIRIQGEIRTLTAQARVSGYIISVLPIALAALLAVISPSYFGPMFSHTLGLILLGGGLFSMAVGFAIIQKIVRIEV